MGEAKRRGTREQRVLEGTQRRAKEAAELQERIRKEREARELRARQEHEARQAQRQQRGLPVQPYRSPMSRFALMAALAAALVPPTQRK
jgi:hypothetical protein